MSAAEEPVMILTESEWLEDMNKGSVAGIIQYPSVLTICGANEDTPPPPPPEICPRYFHLAHLVECCRLEVRGTFDMSRLVEGAKYEMAFILQLVDPAEGWDSPVSLQFELPDGTRRSRDVVLDDIPKNRWSMVSLGEFVATGEPGEIKFSMVEAAKLSVKKGLLIKDFVLWPLDRMRQDESLPMI